MEGVIGRAFAHELEAGRDPFNARFAQAHRAFPRARRGCLAGLPAPPRGPDCLRPGGPIPRPAARGCGIAPTTPALELFARGLIGPGVADCRAGGAVGELLTGVAGSIAPRPRALIAPLSNALYNLCTTPRCRPEAWCRAMAALAGPCGGPEHLLAAGQVAAWLCGLAHYREAALSRARADFPNRSGHSSGSISSALPQAQGEWLEAPGRGSLAGSVARRPAAAADRQETGASGASGASSCGRPGWLPWAIRSMSATAERCWLLFADAFGAIFLACPANSRRTARRGRTRSARTGIVQAPRGGRRSPNCPGPAAPPQRGRRWR